MELLGLFAFVFCLYLLIAPLVAWVRSGNAKAYAEEANAQLRAQGMLVKELQKQISALREELRGAIARFDGVAMTRAPEPETMLDERGAVIEVPSTVFAAGRAAERAPPSAQRTAPAANGPEFAFDPAESGVANAPVSRVEPPERLDFVPMTPEPVLAAAPVFERPALKRELEQIDQEPQDAVSPGPAVFQIGVEPVPASGENFRIRSEPTPVMASATAASKTDRDAIASKPVWTPKPPPHAPPGTPRAPPRPAAPRAPSDLDRGLARLMSSAKQWLLGGNLVAKIGLLILFIGIAFLLRLASAHVEVPIELRLAGIAAGAIGLLIWGWRIRERRPGIALPVQGAALAILMMVTFGAFKLYQLIPAGPTFALLLVLVAFTCILAVLQDALWLAIFGISGGFAVPILLSTGGGSHIALFSYYALLNAGILAIALRRSWRVLNVLGFLFTFVIGTAWGLRSYQPQDYQSTQAFLILFVLFYIAIAVIYAWREAPKLKSYVDGTLVFGVPTVAMGLQYGLVKEMHLGMALSALLLGLLYALTASVLWRLKRENLRLLVESFFALAVVFGTLAIPLAFDGRWTSAAWALEGAGIIWIGLRQRQPLVWRFGMLVQIGSWFAFLKTLIGFDALSALANNVGLGFLLLGVTGVFLALTFRRHVQTDTDSDATARARFGGYATTFIVIAVVWLLAGLWTEIWLRTRGFDRATLYVLSALGLVFGLQFLGRRERWVVPDTLGGWVTAIAGITFLALMGRYMDWHNVGVYAQTSFAQMLGQSSFFGGLLLSAGALVSAFAFKRRIADLEKDVLDSSSASRSSALWFSLAIFWWCGFALHGLAHALAWLTAPAPEATAPWYQVSFWAAYTIGLALSAWGFTALAQAQRFSHARKLLLGFWPIASALAAWIFIVRSADTNAADHLLDFNWNGESGATLIEVFRSWLGGPLSGALVLVALASIGVWRSCTIRVGSLELAADERARSLGIWLTGLGICWYVLIVDGLAQFGSKALAATGLVSDIESARPWLTYADLQLLSMAVSAMAFLVLAKARELPALRWLAAPAAIAQALSCVVIIGMLTGDARLPTIGTGVAMFGMWLAMAWSLRYWQQAGWAIGPWVLRALHFGRVIAPWMMIAPLVSLNVWRWLALPPGMPEAAPDSWVIAGMWPDYLGAWAAIGALVLLLRQSRIGGWPLAPIHDWHARVSLPLGGLWALLLAIYWNLRQDGNMAPLPYLPLLNPLDLTTAFVALYLAYLWRMHREHLVESQHRGLRRLAGLLGFAWFNLMLLRSAAVYLGLPYRFDDLYASQFVQAMLSLVWTLSAFALMRFAARRSYKPLWMVGAALLAVVVLKLFLIDLKNIGSIARIVSFMGVGGLMLLIGYLAPLPRENEPAVAPEG